MKRKSVVIVPLTSALAALHSGAGAATTASGAVERDASAVNSQPQTAQAVPANTTYKSGEDLFGLLVTRNADGTVVAQHSSHSSHGSHASHSSGQ
jgi:hypothetical protein